ncbi:tetratricopeptide repeat protein [Herbiconiux sp. SYSU D00978]|uniref:tetratricopeptide repeat protein n=1 Tax=Herbiconiux sp. SYSU D00978 TaxID=2812562 RepID=UPI0027DB1AF8|nr:tetratricopeptide repeat protein [Herbiconiux sp. SYSU D00978]
MTTWDDDIARFWAEADELDGDALLEGIRELAAQRLAGDAAALFEEASAHDYLGEEARAIPLYRQALAAGLDEVRHSQAVVQLASSLRNVGDAAGSVEVLQDAEGEAAAAFRALALHDLGRHAEALRVALTALAGTLPEYGRAVRAYAEELTSRPTGSQESTEES